MGQPDDQPGNYDAEVIGAITKNMYQNAHHSEVQAGLLVALFDRFNGVFVVDVLNESVPK